MGFNGKNRIELATEVLQGDDRGQLHELFIRKMSLKSLEEPIRNSLTGISLNIHQDSREMASNIAPGGRLVHDYLADLWMRFPPPHIWGKVVG